MPNLNMIKKWHSINTRRCHIWQIYVTVSVSIEGSAVISVNGCRPKQTVKTESVLLSMLRVHWSWSFHNNTTARGIDKCIVDGMVVYK